MAVNSKLAPRGSAYGGLAQRLPDLFHRWWALAERQLIPTGEEGVELGGLGDRFEGEVNGVRRDKEGEHLNAAHSAVGSSMIFEIDHRTAVVGTEDHKVAAAGHACQADKLIPQDSGIVEASQKVKLLFSC